MNKVEASELLKQLDAQRDAYLDTFKQVHELLAQNLASTVSPARKASQATQDTPLPEPQSPRSPRPSFVGGASEREPYARKVSAGIATLTTSSESKGTGEDSDSDDDEALYVSSTLEPQKHDEETLRKHLQSYQWTVQDAKVLETVVDNPARMLQHPLIPNRKGPLADRSQFSHCQVFDVGPDGAPLEIEWEHVERESSRAQAIWYAIKELNQPPKERLAVGRITIVREPSPILFGAIHYTLCKSFDMDELFRHLVNTEGSSANMFRAFDEDVRKQRSFVFKFEYFTIIAKDCQPLRWQLADRQEQRSSHHIPVTRCSSVVALVLNGPAVRKVKNPARRATVSHGFAYDTWSSWQVVNLQCFPDWKASMDVHDSTKHYVNGPEAFLVTLLGEFRDAQKRFEHIYKEITRLITPPLEFMFDSAIRDSLLFEDKDFTYSRRYFWAYQTLGLMNDSIKCIIDAYEDTFTTEVWEGTHKKLWPLPEQGSARNVYFKKKMAVLKFKFEVEMKNLRTLMYENDERRDEIENLKENLFTGTSIQESRKSVENTEITIQQGHNIKLLTLVSIFFLPLTFVTSVFGMTNMPTDRHYWVFGIVTATVCVPFFVLIGSLNTSRGMHFWRHKTHQAFDNIGAFLAWIFGCGRKRAEGHGALEAAPDEGANTLEKTTSTPKRYVHDMHTRRLPKRRSISRQNAEVKSIDRRDSESARPRSGSHLAEMWIDERERQRSPRYSPHV